MINEEKIEKEIKQKEDILIKELLRLMKKENPGPNDLSYSIAVHERLVYLQQIKEKIRYEKILKHFKKRVL